MEEDTKMEKYDIDNAIESTRERTSIEVKNLIVNSAIQKDMVIGNVESLADISRKVDIESVFWNEDEMSLVVFGKSDMVKFKPELDATVESFFERDRKSREDLEGNIVNVWDGDYRPLVFKKTDFLKWVHDHADMIPKEVVENVKSLKIKHTANVNEDLLEEGMERKLAETQYTTNVPKKFCLTLPLMEGISADLEFECEIVNLPDRYGNETDKRGVQLRCLNARKIKRDMMQTILEQLPKAIPRYYGKIVRGHDAKRRDW